MVYIVKRDDESLRIFYEYEAIPEELRGVVKVFDSIPEGEGVLRMSDDGSLYYEPYPEPEPVPRQPINVEQMQAEILLNTELLLIYKKMGL